jgi:hypothetical protein
MPNEIDLEYLGSFLDEIDAPVEEGEDWYTVHLDEFSVSISLELHRYSDLKENDRVTRRKRSEEYDFEKEMQLWDSYVPCACFQVTLRGPEKASYSSQLLFSLYQEATFGRRGAVELVEVGDDEVALVTTVLQQLTGDRTRDRKKLKRGLERIEGKFKNFHLMQDKLRDK